MAQQDSQKKNYSIILLIVGLVILPFAIVSVWLRGTLLNTNTYVATVAPLSKNEAINKDLSTYITNKLFAQVDVKTRINNALPEDIKFLADPLTVRVKDFTENLISKFINSDAFNKLWVEANRVAHQQIVKLLLGKGEAITVHEGTVVLDLGAVVDQIKIRLNEAGINIFDNVTLSQADREIIIFQSQQLAKAQQAVATLNQLAVILSFLTIIALIAAFWLSPDRFQSTFQLGIGLIIVAVVLAINIASWRWLFIDAAGPNLSNEAAAALFDTLVRFLWSTNLVLFLLGLFIIGGLMLAK